MKRRILFFLGSLWILTTQQSAQTELGSVNITNYEPEQYKAQQQNWVAVQDHRGVMYFGNTDGGILEFDGRQWRFIPTPVFSIIRALACGPDGTIYYGAIDDFGYLAASHSGKLAAISLRESIPPADRSFADIWQALSSRYGVYFLASSKIFRLVNGKVTSLSGNFTPFQACLLNDCIFCVDSDKGICMVAGDQVLPIPQLAGVYNGQLITLAPFGRHELLAGRGSGDFLRIDLSAFWDETSRRYDTSRQAPSNIIKTFPTELADFIKENNGSLVPLVPIGTDRFAIGTLKGGIVTFDRTGKIVRFFNKKHGLLDDTINGIFIDRTGNMWACTNGGISYIESSVPQSFFGPRENIEGLSLSAQFHNGRMYVGTMQGLYVLAPQHFALPDKQQTFTALKNSPNGVWQFLEVDGELMAATSQGLFRIQGDEAIKIRGTPSGAYCLSMSIKRWPGHIFVGHIGSIDVVKRTAGQWEFIGKIEGLDKNIRGLAEDVNGDLWAGTDVSGLLRIHFSADKPTQAIIQRFGPEQGLPGLVALWSTIVRGNMLFVTTPKGLYQTVITPDSVRMPERIRFTPEINMGKSFVNPPVAVSGMNFDKEGGIFFASDAGAVWAIPEKDGHYRIEKRPFMGTSLPTMPIYCHPDGSVWLPGGKLLYRVDLKVAKDYDQIFDVLVRKITTEAKRPLFEGTHAQPGSEFGQQLTIFASNQDMLDIPQLPFHENALAFEFAAAFYEKPGTMQFQYLLEGFDKEWSAWTGDAKKEYTNLPEGKYRFRVQAKNIYGTMGREAIYSLRILPPWYRTVWAYFLWIISGGAALVGIIYLNTLKLRHQKANLEKIVAERTQQLREAAEQLREAAEQLREASLTDPLTGLRNRRFIAEVLQNDIFAFIGLKNFQLNAKNKRRTMVEDTVLGLFIMDIDFFKKVNDTYGHDAGDRVLKQFATILSGSVRLDDAVMRVGGEEFLVILKKTKPEYLPVFAAKILEKVAAMPFDIGGGTTIRKTCSIGFTDFPIYNEQPGLLTFEQSTMIADLGLFHAKNHGRNQAIRLTAGPHMPSGEEIIQKTVSSLEFALQEGYLQIDNVIPNQ